MKALCLFLILFFSSLLNAQRNEVCKCTAKKKYQDSLHAIWKKYEFTPISKEETLKPVFDFIKIDFLYTPANSAEIVDSVQLAIEKALPKKKNFDMESMERDLMIYDSINKAEMAKKIGNISKPLVIKSEKNENRWAILYRDYLYDEMLAFGAGYWLSLSEDHGKTWKKYYTGITEFRNYFFKQNSKLPLWKDENHLQIEADLVRMIQPRMHPMPPEYETVRDNALITLDLQEILKDTDQDGLTDIEERNLFLNPLSADTDGDGIPDGEDLNPRFRSSENDFTLLYEGLISDYDFPYEGDFGSGSFEIDLEKLKSQKENRNEPKANPFFEEYPFLQTTKLLVTDDPHLQQIYPAGNRIIILTGKEYEKFIKEYHSNLEQLHYGPLFKCDDEDAYLLETSASYSGETYKIIRTKKGWKVITVSSWIS